MKLKPSLQLLLCTALFLVIYYVRSGSVMPRIAFAIFMSVVTAFPSWLALKWIKWPAWLVYAILFVLVVVAQAWLRIL